MSMSVGRKLSIITLIFSLAAIVPFGILAYESIRTARESFIHDRFEQLESIRSIKSNQIHGYFDERLGDVGLLAKGENVINTFNELLEFRREAKVDPSGSFPVNAPAYVKLWEQRIPYMKDYVKSYGYYDIFIIDGPSGQVMLTEAKEPDLGSNLATGPYKDSPLGKLWRRVMQSGKVAFEDFEPYAPSKGEPAAFVGAPIIKYGKPVGVAALQISIDAINKIMQERTGMGKTGETYLVGPDKLMRSDSFLDPANHSVKASFANPDKGKVDTEAAREALSGKSGHKIVIDYNGNPVLSAFAPVEVAGVKWAILAEIDEVEVISESTAAQNLLNMVFVISAFSLLVIIAVIALTIITSRHMTKTMTKVVSTLNDGADQIASASNEVSSSSQSLAQGSSEQAASLEETSSSLEELASMAGQNSDHAQQANSLMEQTKRVVSQANESMAKLRESMETISKASDDTAKIIKTIDEIAFQTNLLALNAAVEAARAGEAGAGFAVVADEVRNLAMRAAEAAKNTQQLIEDNIKNIKNGSALAASTDEAFSQVAESSAKVADLVGEIAAASSEQAQGVSQINQAATQMDKVTQQVASNAEEAAAASEELSAQSATMRGMVEELSGLVFGSAGKVQAHKPSKQKPVHELLPPAIDKKPSATKKRAQEAIPFDGDDFKDF